MKKDDLIRAIGEVDPAFLREAEPKPPRRRSRSFALAAAAAALAFVLGLTALFGRTKDPLVSVDSGSLATAPEDEEFDKSGAVPNEGELSTAPAAVCVVPEAKESDGEICAQYAVAKAQSLAQPRWEVVRENFTQTEKDAWIARRDADRTLVERLDPFFRKTLPVILPAGDGVNHLYAPLNLYFALALFAETTAGETQKQVFSVMGVENLRDMRTVVQAMIRLCVRDDEKCTALFSNSVWLDSGLPYKKATLETLAREYGADSFSGDTSDPAFSEALRDWLNASTRRLISDLVEREGFQPDDVFCLASAVYFEARWQGVFREENNFTDVFHAATGDQTAVFMHEEGAIGRYAKTSRFLAFEKKFDFDAGGSMVFVLPAEGVAPEELLNDPMLLAVLAPRNIHTAGGFRDKEAVADLFVPKFFVTEQKEISKELEQLGMTKIFSDADFSPLTSSDVFLSRVNHGAGVAVDETGVKAAAYTTGYGSGGLPKRDPIVMRLDRPFLFFVRGEAGVPLFCGVVNQL